MSAKCQVVSNFLLLAVQQREAELTEVIVFRRYGSVFDFYRWHYGLLHGTLREASVAYSFKYLGMINRN